MLIKTISVLTISDVWEGKLIGEVFLKQGELDGACGPYSLMMALILSDAISKNKAIEIWDGSVDGRTTFAKFIKKLDVLFSNGTTDEVLHTLFSHIKGLIGTKKINERILTNIEPTEKSKISKNTAYLHAVKNHIDKYDQPVILSLDWGSGFGHYIVAVGYQLKVSDGKSTLAHVLTLDPGVDIANVGAWNGVLGQGKVGSKKLVYATEDGSSENCLVQGGIGLISTTPAGAYRTREPFHFIV